MYTDNVSPEFRQALMEGAIQQIYAHIHPTVGESFTVGNESIKKPVISLQCTTATDSFTIGELYTGTVEFTLFDENVDTSNLQGGTVALEFRLQGYTERIPLGVWTITDPQRSQNGSIVVRGVDNTYKLDTAIPAQAPAFYTFQACMDIVEEYSGLEFAQDITELSTLAERDISGNKAYSSKLYATCRAEVRAMAEYIGGIAYIDRNGDIAFRKYGDNATVLEIPANKRFKANLKEYTCEVASISDTNKNGYTVTSAVRTGQTGTTKIGLKIANNYFVEHFEDADTKSELDDILDNIDFGAWVAGEIDYYGDPCIDLGDKLTLTGGINGSGSTAFVVTAISWQFRGAQTLISAGAVENTVTSSGGSSGGGGTSTNTIVIEDTLKAVEITPYAGELSNMETVIGDADFKCDADTLLHINCTACIEGTNSADTEIRHYLDGDELDFYTVDTISAGEHRTVSANFAVSAEKGEHTLEVKATGDGTLHRFSGTIWGANIADRPPEPPSEYHIYGASWDKTANVPGRNSWTRTDDAANFTDPVPYTTQQSGSSPFDNCYPWSEMQKVEIGGRMYVRIPVYWYKITNTATELKIQVADYAAAGFNVSPAHCVRTTGGEKTVLYENIYVGRYTAKDGLPVASGTSPQHCSSFTDLSNADYACQQNGTKRTDHRTQWTMDMLYLVEAASWNQIEGRGGGTKSRAVGGTDNMPYHTGIMAADRYSQGDSQWRYIENYGRNDDEIVKGYDADATGNDLKVYYASEDGNTSVYTSAPKFTDWENRKVRDFISNNTPGYEWALVPTCTPPASSAAPEEEVLGDSTGSYDYRHYNYNMANLKYLNMYRRFSYMWLTFASGGYRVMRFTAE
jgi:hypothetical protein